MIIGRAAEQDILKSVYGSESAEFVAVYGRRRVGKTFLIKQYFAKKKNTVFFNATGLKEGSRSEQLANFMDRVGECFYSGVSLESQATWRAAFKVLNQAIANQDKYKKIVIFLDELPWMATQKSNLLPMLDYFWNQYWSVDNRVKLIICGSSASWIINKIIRNRGGLHNRLTETIHLEPYDLIETRSYLQHLGLNLTNKQVLLIYMVTGGVPFYLSKIKGKGSAIQLIEKLAFTKKSFLLDEFDNLFASLFKNHEVHIGIVKLLASSREGVAKSEIMKKLNIQGGTGTKKLQELEDAGFVMGFKPIFHKERRTYYRLVDEYTYFYFKWLEPLKTVLRRESLGKGTLQAMQVTPEWNSWKGYAFESVCYKHIKQIRTKVGLSPLDMAGTWRYAPKKNSKNMGAQIDLLFDRRDDTVSIFEIKCTDKPFVITKAYREDLLRKLSVFQEQTRTKKNLLLSFVSANGLKSGDYAKEMVCDVVTLDDLFVSSV